MTACWHEEHANCVCGDELAVHIDRGVCRICYCEGYECSWCEELKEEAMKPCWHEELCECGDVRGVHRGNIGLGSCIDLACRCTAFKRAVCVWCEQIRQDSQEVEA